MSACRYASFSVWDKSQNRPGRDPGKGGLFSAASFRRPQGTDHPARGPGSGHTINLQPHGNSQLSRRRPVPDGRRLVSTLSQTQGRRAQPLSLSLSGSIRGAPPLTGSNQTQNQKPKQTTKPQPEKKNQTHRP